MESNLQKGYQTACQTAIAAFANANLAELARMSESVLFEESRSLRVQYLGQPYDLRWPSGDVCNATTGDSAPLATAVLLLNYVLTANHQQPTGELIAFREIPGAATYEPSFNKRAVNPLLRAFDNKPELFTSVATRLGGTAATIADISFTIPVLPLLPVTYGIWHGDEEFPASAAILFDASARKLLSIECLVVAASNAVYAMMGIARSLGT